MSAYMRAYLHIWAHVCVHKCMYAHIKTYMRTDMHDFVFLRIREHGPDTFPIGQKTTELRMSASLMGESS